MNDIVPTNPGVLMTQATDVAGVCGEIVKRTAQNIQGRKYVKVEGWQSIAAAYGCVASSKDVERVDGGFRAIGELRRANDGHIIATAEGFLGDDEKMWASRPEYAKRAMAQTRAISRVCRSAFAFVVVMIDGNLSTTPAEEMTFEHEPAPQGNASPSGADSTEPARAVTDSKPLSPSQERLIRAKLNSAGVKEEDFTAKFPDWSLTPKEGKILVPKAEVNNVLKWIEEQVI